MDHLSRIAARDNDLRRAFSINLKFIKNLLQINVLSHFQPSYPRSLNLDYHDGPIFLELHEAMEVYEMGNKTQANEYLAIKYMVAWQRVRHAIYEMQALLSKAGFKPSQPRVPPGHPDSGQWTQVSDSQAIPTPRAKPRVSNRFSENATRARDTAGKIQRLTYETVKGGKNMASWSVRWRLSGASPKGGYIIQEVRTTYHIKDINTGESKIQDVHFWEAWKVSPGKQITDEVTEGHDHDDIFAFNVDFYNTTGRIDSSTSARFYEGLELPEHFITYNPQTFAGPLRSTTEDPDLSSNNSTNDIERAYNPK